MSTSEVDGYFAGKLMGIYNDKGIFDNKFDDLVGLETQLNKYFKDVEITMNGCVAIFSAKKCHKLTGVIEKEQ